MSRRNGDRSHDSTRKNIYTELFQAHERSLAEGQPLFTPAGCALLRKALQALEHRELRKDDPHEPFAQGMHCLPFWDLRNRQLWLGPHLLKEFRQPAPHQTMLLDTFQEQGWTDSRIDDPLHPLDGDNSSDIKRRLHETIKNLNRGLPSGTIRFRGDGTGEGVTWEYDARQPRPNGHLHNPKH